jgi:RNA polymerase sigma-70 factor (ECF subfamily)
LSVKENEIEIWNKLRSGDEKALGNLYDLYIDILFSYGKQITNDRNHVKDAIHDLFLDLYKYRKNLSETSNVKFYLLRSLKNKIIKKNDKKVISLERNIIEERKINTDYSESIEDDIIKKEMSKERALKVANALSLLSKTQRKAMALRFTQGKNYEEIAEIMGITVQTSRTLIYRAIKELRKNLAISILLIKSFF